MAYMLALACAFLTLAGCGDDDPRGDTAGTTATGRSLVAPTNLLTDEDVRALREGSPERALAEWFQAVQFRDVDTARSFVTKSAYRRVGERRFAASVKRVGTSLGRPEIVGSRRLGGGRGYNIRVLIKAYDGVARRPRFSTPASFVMVDENGWRLDDLYYLTEANQSIADARRRRAGRP